MRPAPQLAQPSPLPQNRDHDRIEEDQIERTFCEQTKSEKNPWRCPRDPTPTRLVPPAQPANKRERGKRDVECFDLDQAPLFEKTEIRQPNQCSDERSHRSEPPPRDADERERDRQNA